MRIQSFHEYCLSLDESLNNPYSWRTTAGAHQGNSYDAVFTVPATASSVPLDYGVTFTQDKGQEIRGTNDHPWEFTFGALNDRDGAKTDGGAYGYDVTHTGHAFSVFATVIVIMKAFITKHHPTVIYFSASESSRKKLYDRFVKMVSAAVPGYHGYKLTTAMSRANGYDSYGPDWLTPNGYVIVSSKISPAEYRL